MEECIVTSAFDLNAWLFPDKDWRYNPPESVTIRLLRGDSVQIRNKIGEKCWIVYGGELFMVDLTQMHLLRKHTM